MNIFQTSKNLVNEILDVINSERLFAVNYPM
jgi:hypothetical protein